MDLIVRLSFYMSDKQLILNLSCMLTTKSIKVDLSEKLSDKYA